MDESFRTTIRTNLRSQDNRATHLPVFCVQQRRRIYGMDPAYADAERTVWISDGEQVTDEGEANALEELWNDTGEETDGYQRTAYMDVWEFVTACFTEKGAEDYIAANGHRLTTPRIYVESAYRNHEWEVVRDFLMSDAPDIHRALGRPARDGHRLVEAIRRFTLDMPNDQPNGETESAILDLDTALHRGDLDAARRAFAVMMRSSADDVTELREAAENAIPGVDFKGAPNPTPCRSVMLGEPLFSFESLQQWVNKGRSWYATCGFPLDETIALDAIGRVVMKGAEFMRADREGTYPITVYSDQPGRPTGPKADRGRDQAGARDARHRVRVGPSDRRGRSEWVTRSRGTSTSFASITDCRATTVPCDGDPRPPATRPTLTRPACTRGGPRTARSTSPSIGTWRGAMP